MPMLENKKRNARLMVLQLSHAPPIPLSSSCKVWGKYKSCYSLGANGVLMASQVYELCVGAKWPLYSDENALQNYFPALT